MKLINGWVEENYRALMLFGMLVEILLIAWIAWRA
jgi:hypothetical protein